MGGTEGPGTGSGSSLGGKWTVRLGDVGRESFSWASVLERWRRGDAQAPDASFLLFSGNHFPSESLRVSSYSFLFSEEGCTSGIQSANSVFKEWQKIILTEAQGLGEKEPRKERVSES